jgi:hypothetical protein
MLPTDKFLPGPWSPRQIERLWQWMKDVQRFLDNFVLTPPLAGTEGRLWANLPTNINSPLSVQDTRYCTTLALPCGPSDTILEIADPSPFPLPIQYVILVESELMTCLGGTGTTTLPLFGRGVGGTTPVAHPAGAQVCNQNPIGSTLADFLPASMASLTIADPLPFPQDGLFYFWVDQEAMLCIQGGGTTVWQVSRGAFGTAVVDHANGAPVYPFVPSGEQSPSRILFDDNAWVEPGTPDPATGNATAIVHEPAQTIRLVPSQPNGGSATADNYGLFDAFLQTPDTQALDPNQPVYPPFLSDQLNWIDGLSVWAVEGNYKLGADAQNYEARWVGSAQGRRLYRFFSSCSADLNSFHQKNNVLGECWYPTGEFAFFTSDSLAILGYPPSISNSYGYNPSTQINPIFNQGNIQLIPYYSGEGGLVDGVGIGLGTPASTATFGGIPAGTGCRIVIAIYDAENTASGEMYPTKLLYQSPEIQADDWTLGIGAIKLKISKPIRFNPCSIYWFAMQFKQGNVVPNLTSATPVAGEGLGVDTSWSYVITAIVGNTETTFSNVQSATTYNSGSVDFAQIALQWSTVPGASSYRIYRASPIALDGTQCSFHDTATGTSYTDSTLDDPDIVTPYTISNHLNAPLPSPWVQQASPWNYILGYDGNFNQIGRYGLLLPMPYSTQFPLEFPPGAIPNGISFGNGPSSSGYVGGNNVFPVFFIHYSGE